MRGWIILGLIVILMILSSVYLKGWSDGWDAGVAFKEKNNDKD